MFEGLSAIATAGALAAAAIAGRLAKKPQDIGSDRDDQGRQTERRQQAAQISAWAAMQIGPDGKPTHVEQLAAGSRQW